MTGPGSITCLLRDWSHGNRAALDELTPYVYRELHALARRRLRQGGPNQVFQPTELINELFLRLMGQFQPMEWEGRAHFMGVAARLMRNVLVDHSRARKAAKRGGGLTVLTLDEGTALSPGRPADVVELDEALNHLARHDERKARIIELRYFGGMSREEIAGTLQLTVATVKRDLRLGEAWLRCHLAGGV